MAMTIIEWMLGEVTVPRPPNRLNITSVRALRDHKPKRVMVSMADWTEDEKRERRKTMGREGARRRTAAKKLKKQQDDEAPSTREMEEAVEISERFNFKTGRKRVPERG